MNNYTTPEQSKILLELGLPQDSADCSYFEFEDIDIDAVIKGEQIISNPLLNANILNLPNGDRTITQLKKNRGEEHIYPCWSVGKLIEIYETCSTRVFDRWSHNGRYLPLIDDCIEHIKFAINQNTIISIDFSKLKTNYEHI